MSHHNRLASPVPPQPSCVLGEPKELLAYGLRCWLECSDRFHCKGVAHEGFQLVDLVREHAPDIVILSLELPGLTGIEILQRLTELGPTPRTVVLSPDLNPDRVQAAVKAGAHAYLPDDTTFVEFIRALDLVSNGHEHFPAQVMPSLTAALRDANDLPDCTSLLSSKEREVLHLAAHGASNRQIATQMILSEATVKTHLESVMHKLDARNRTEAAVKAQRGGYIG